MSSHFDERPYIQLIETLQRPPQDIRVWLVDGTWVRKYIQKEFNNFAHHYTKPQGVGGDAVTQIPEHEFWIDQGANPAEIPFFVDHLAFEHYLMSQKGWSYQKAEREGIKIEERERNRQGFKGERSFKVNPELTILHSLPDCTIYLTDGKIVRDKLDPRFCSGGHSEVYGYVPENHVWIDNTSVPREWVYYTIHELHEFRDMKLGKEYLAAHKIASRIEWRCRWDNAEVLRQQKQMGLI